tara:strand:- start:85 stop:468 length:384 start_codon:yes stop_codon:yes gene_type:complete
MATTSYGRLNPPPLHPDRRANQLISMNIQEERRVQSLEDVIKTMPDIDQDYMYQIRKQSQQQERLLGAYLRLIRKFDFLPKKILLQGFQDAVKHIYSANEEEIRQREFEENICERAEDMVTKLQEEY